MARFHSSFFLLVLASFWSPSQGGAACARDFIKVRDICVNFTIEEITYCKAQTYCHRIGGELITGSNYMEIDGKPFDNQPERYWIGLTDLKNERNQSKNSWAWTDGSLTRPSDKITWSNGYPEGSNGEMDRDCTYVLGTKKVRVLDSTCYLFERAPMCQQRTVLQPTSDFFKMEDIPMDKFPDTYYADTACGSRKTANSVIDCAIMCKTDDNGWCVAIYFHEERLECITILFTDVTLRLEPNDGKWKKFLL